MNPAGIAVFYGAVSQEVAVAEVRPAIGSIVVVCSFTITGEQRLLDLTNLGLGSHSGSIFAPDFAERAGRLRFLQGFHYLITQPVQPEEEVLQYLPTQAVAEYVAHVLGFDGILYGSAQTGELDAIFDPGEWAGSVARAECNVVLFGDPLTGTHSVEYDTGSAKGVWVTSVTYSYSDVYLDDERGGDF